MNDRLYIILESNHGLAIRKSSAGLRVRNVHFWLAVGDVEVRNPPGGRYDGNERRQEFTRCGDCP